MVSFIRLAVAAQWYNTCLIIAMLRVQVQPTLQPLGERKWQKGFFYQASSGSSVVEHQPNHPKVQGISPAAPASTRREKKAKSLLNQLSGSIKVVQPLPHHCNVEGSSLAHDAATRREKMAKCFLNKASCGSSVVEHLPHSTHVAATRRQKMARRFFLNQLSSCIKVIQPLPRHSNVEG